MVSNGLTKCNVTLITSSQAKVLFSEKLQINPETIEVYPYRTNPSEKYRRNETDFDPSLAIIITN